MEKVICNKDLIQKVRQDSSYVSAHLLREPIFDLIKKDHPEFTRDCYIDDSEVTRYRNMHLQSLIKKDQEEYNKLDKNVIESILNKKIISDNIEDDWNVGLTTGQKIADKVAQFGGSWTFIIAFGVFLFLWMATNVWLLAAHPFDPYPFILLNLFLSTLAAIQAPIIMMSQNRQEQKDRKRGENDYKVNLKAELEIKALHDKIDHIITYQNQKLLEVLEMNTDYLEEVKDILKNGKK